MIFQLFAPQHALLIPSIKKINALKVKKKGDEINIEFKSKSFLQNQVRSMVGSLKYLSSSKWTFKDF